MTRGSRMVRLAGYDADIVGQLPSAARVSLYVVSCSCLLPCTLIGLAAGYAAWLTEHALWLSVLCVFAFGLLTLNLLRVAAAGGGIPPHCEPRAAFRYRPPATPSLLLGFFALFFAQPAMLPLFARAHDPQIELYRDELLRLHSAAFSPAVKSAGARVATPEAPYLQRVRAERVRSYREEVNGASFLARRVHLSWNDTRAAGSYSIAFVLACLLPLLLRMGPLLGAVRAYEIARHRAVRKTVTEQFAQTQGRLRAELGRFARFAPRTGPGVNDPFADEVRGSSHTSTLRAGGAA